jgi:actin-like ATPase involved in cell morphogenesis
MNIGIDLGTTYSVIAVSGEIKTQGNYPEAQYLPECNVTIIPSPMGDLAIPSAFWCDPNDPGNIYIGSEAKDKASEGESPILFSKRSIGTTQILKIGESNYTAKQVATTILKYLKRCAEEALGMPVRRAVITHPAYFSLNQVEETRQAAIDAGFDMSNGEQMMMEPAAATMAFIASDPRDNITALTYDLGGGTFDVTVLERKDGLIVMKAFDGNHLLGGYNFDRRFINWLLESVRSRLKDTGRSFTLDENNPSDQACWARLLQFAEKIKLELVEKPTAKVPLTIKADNILYDKEGKSIQILERMTREEYTELIRDLLEDTIEKSKNALNKAGMAPDEIDVIIQVGGSSYGQWVQEAVKKAFPGKEIVLFNPDVCVAAGAAIFAKTLPDSDFNPGAEFEIMADVSRFSLFRKIALLGTVQRNGGGLLDDQLRESLKIFLETPESGVLGPVALNEEGVFLFQDVILLEGEPTNLTIRIKDADDRERGEQPLCIEYKLEGDTVIAPLTVVPRSIFIRTASGLVPIATEADPLPKKSIDIRLTKINDDPTLHLEVFQEADWVTTIQVEDLPEDAGKGSSVLFTVEITRQNVMRGMVKVKRKDGTLATEWPVEIAFPPIHIPDIPELKETFSRLDAKRLEIVYNEKDPVRRTKLGGLGEKHAKKIRSLFAENHPDPLLIHQAIKEFEAMLTPERDEMQPSMEEFKELADTCRELIAQDESDQKKQNHDTLEKIERDATDARHMKNKRKWGNAFENLKKLYLKLTGGGGGPLPDTETLKEMFHEEIVENLRMELSEKVRNMQSMQKYDSIKHGPTREKIANAVNEIQDRIRAIDNQLEPEAALSKLQSMRRQKAKISEDIRILDVDVVVDAKI